MERKKKSKKSKETSHHFEMHKMLTGKQQQAFYFFLKCPAIYGRQIFRVVVITCHPSGYTEKILPVIYMFGWA
jgi:hypothetical protein